MSAPSPATPAIWLLTHDAVGLRNQAMGLAEHVAASLQGVITQKTVNLRKPWRWLPGHWVPRAHEKLTADSAPIAPPWPEIIISCGRLGATAALGIKRASGGQSFLVHIQNPQMPLGYFDVIAPPAHDGLHGTNVFPTRGALHHMSAAKIAAAIDEQTRIQPALSTIRAQQPVIGVLIGGSNATASLTPEKSRQLIEQLLGLAKAHGAHLWLTASRRTGAANLAAMRQALAGSAHWLWDDTGANPYAAILGVADYLIVTGDSVSMVSEAASTGKPVYTLDFDAYSGRLQQFHQRMQQEGVTRPFNGTLDTWSYEPVNDTPRIAALVCARFTQTRDALSADQR